MPKIRILLFFENCQIYSQGDESVIPDLAAQLQDARVRPMAEKAIRDIFIRWVCFLCALCVPFLHY